MYSTLHLYPFQWRAIEVLCGEALIQPPGFCLTVVIFLLLQEAVFEFRCRVAEFNACVPYSGVGTLSRLEDGALSMLLSLLPAAGGLAAAATPQAAIHAIDLLQCLQRLVSSGFVASSVVHTQGGQGTPARTC